MLLGMLGTIWECKSTFPTIKLLRSKHRSSISDENPVSECTESVKYTLDLEDSRLKKKYKIYP